MDTFYYKYIKRTFDILFSVILIVLLSPLFFLLLVLIKFFLGTPVIFKQKRPGVNGDIFTLYKFRSMTEKKDGSGNLLSDQERLTKFGSFLRSTSLDELPELINIFKGDMSFVGPRPLLCEYLLLYNDFQRKRHMVRPGLTGLAQVNGRNGITWEEKFNYDCEYIKKITFKNDFKIILLTIKKVLIRENINSTNHATVEKFQGNKSEGE